jgi:CheY-like chemotaxis protein
MAEYSQDGPPRDRRHATRRIRDVFAAFTGEHAVDARRDLDRRRAARRAADRSNVGATPEPGYTLGDAHADPSRPSILVVDDVEATRLGLAELLRLRGYNAVQATDGADAVRMLRAHPHVRAIILDLQMPRFDGFWFREQQMRDAALASVPVVVFTGSGVSPEEVARQLQVPEVLLKPFSVDRLFQIIERHCSSSHAP